MLSTYHPLKEVPMKIFPDDPMMEAVTIAAILLFAIGFLFGFGVGVRLVLLLP